MSITIAKPPIEIDVKAVTPESDALELAEIELAAYIKSSWENAKFVKQETVERLLQCERLRRGVYDPDRAIEIAKTGGSDIYMR